MVYVWRQRRRNPNLIQIGFLYRYAERLANGYLPEKISLKPV
jgi:hypothetical protein